MPEKLSVIVPVMNEADLICHCLEHLQPLREKGHEVIVVDGGSHDRTRELALPLSDYLIQHPRGRARQMNAGAAFARGSIYIFLHVDTLLPKHADKKILESLGNRHGWGFFSVRLSGRRWMYRIIETMMNLRTGITGIATGDHVLFISRELFDDVDGFDDLDLMEDIAISQKLGHRHKPVRLVDKVLTSSRRWENNGIIRTIIRMWWLRLSFYLGADASGLARQYE